ncbi:bacterial proteasome activator family protein [Phycicoccus sp. HDW14]|uniref:bacterial proteasome activator family protein n=1 Tax=Phycicoccus sp. HDW14 TaxID=2714941 RepID=UPI00140EBA90|nr:bacterial proteasome activator family protein [Phycicoccus sp. HDW14]QIM22608.1 bacterial proteasome activator family protein [Phycicoccus sp. HDW14]
MSEPQRPDRDDDDSRAVPATVVGDPERIVVVTPDGMGVAPREPEPEPADERERPTNPADLVEQPAKVMRIGSMVKQLLEEVRSSPLDDKGRARLAEIHDRSIAELKDGLAPELVAELERIALPFKDDTPSDAELRIAQAQLVGWLEGLFHGIQTALVAQQMAAQAQLQQMRALPPGMAHGPGHAPSAPGGLPVPQHPGEPGHTEGTGQYL